MLVSKLAVIEEFARDARLTTALKNELRVALQYSTEQSSLSWSDKQNLLSELPKKLRYEVALAMHQGAAKSLHFFDGKDPIFVAAIVPFMQPIFVKAKVSVFQQGEYADEVYFIVKGRVAFVLEEGGFVYRTLHEGAYFGDIEVIQMTPRRYSVSAAVNCNLLTMKKPLMDVVQADFPAYWTEMKALAEARDAVNDNSKKEFLSLLALKKAGQLDKTDPKLVREKLRRITAPRKVTEETVPSTANVATLKSYIEDSVESLGTVQKDVTGVRRTAEAVVALALKKDPTLTPEHAEALRKLFDGPRHLSITHNFVSNSAVVRGEVVARAIFTTFSPAGHGHGHGHGYGCLG